MSSKVKVILVALAVIAAGILTGYLLSLKFTSNRSGVVSGKNVVNTTSEIGVKDAKAFPDSTSGTLEKGGLNGEGTHKLILDSNPKNAAYLVSSVVDLDQFVGKHIEVWGQTMKAQKVAWLMDVGLVKILE